MNYQSLYQEFKYKQLQEKQLQDYELARIQEISNEPKININSTSILLKRTMEILDQFPDEQLVNLQSSIPILRAVGLLQLLTSVVEARELLSENPDGMGMEMRLRKQVQFLYYLWDMIDEEEVECRELKQIIELLQSKKKNELKTILLQMYNSEQKIQHTLKSYLILSTNQQYYKHINKPIKFHHSNKENNSSLYPQQQSNPLYYSKLDKMQRSGELGSPIYDKLSSKSGHKFATTIDPNLKTNEFLYTCQLNTSQEKELIQRLYKNDIYKQRQQQKKEKDEEREQAELRECTFKPTLAKRGKSATSKSYNQIKGYDKAINRLKAGNEKNKISKEMRDYKPVGENYEKLRQKGLNPPKFLERKKKQEQRVLFIISFDLGRHKTNVKIRENDTQESVAQRICKIYSLKKQFYEEIKQIVRNQLDAYYQEQEELLQAGEEIC